MHNWFSNLRGKLIASHLAVIGITLLLVTLISAGLLRQYENELESRRLKELAAPLTLASGLIQNAGNRQVVRVDAIDQVAAENDVRLLVFDQRGYVLYDTEERSRLAGSELVAFQPEIGITFEIAERTGGSVQRFVEPADGADDPFGDDGFLVAVPGGRNASIATGVVAPERRYPLLEDFLPRILLVTAIALAIASVAGYFLSKRISAPITRLRTAANAMAGGALAQQVPGEGPDEIGQLVSSFNQMSRQIAETYSSQRSLLADVAHELRTPLTSVQGYTQALQDDVIITEAERDNAYGVINREAQRMGTLIAQLLDLARLESGQSVLQPNPVDLVELAHLVQDRFLPVASAAGVTLDVVSPQSQIVQGDDERLTQAVSNLVANAIKHTPAGGVVTVSVGAAPQPGISRIDVSDSGEGLNEDDLPHLFNRFYRAAPRTGDEGGFGLGLAITREIAELHGGMVTAKNNTTGGATFAMTLPVSQEVRTG